MRTVTRDLLAMTTLTLLGTLALSGCASEPAPRVSESTAPTDAPVFASDAEALAAATEAYAAYDAITVTIGATGGMQPERIEPFVTDEYYPSLIKGFQKFQESGYLSEGISRFDTVSLIDRSEIESDFARVEVYLCSDVTEIRLRNEAGQDVTPENRPNRVPLQVVLVSSGADPSILLISEESVWPGQDFCLL